MADLTGLGAIFNLGGTIIDKLFPDKNEAAKMKVRLVELQQAGEFREWDHLEKMSTAQTEINKVEAASSNLFVAGWRPSVGWCCVATLFFNYIGTPILGWLSPALGIPPPPHLDLGELLPILLGMLGLGAMRTQEKIAVIKNK